MSRELAKKPDETTNLPVDASWEDRYGADGTYTDREAHLTPQIKILDKGSPQVLKSNPGYIEGARPYMIYLTSNEKPLLDGETEGIIFQPCHFYTVWQVRGLGTGANRSYGGEFSEPQEGWVKVKDPTRDFIYYKVDGNSVANLIHYHVGHLLLDGHMQRYAIAMGATNIFPSREFNGLIMGRYTSSGAVAPRYLYFYRLKVVRASNAQYEWGKWKSFTHSKATEQQFEMGRSFLKLFQEGKASVQVDESSDYQQQQPSDDERGEDAPL